MKVRVTFPLPRGDNRGFGADAGRNYASIRAQLLAPNSDAVTAIRLAAERAAGIHHTVSVESGPKGAILRIYDTDPAGRTLRERQAELREALTRVTLDGTSNARPARWEKQWDKNVRRHGLLM